MSATTTAAGVMHVFIASAFSLCMVFACVLQSGCGPNTPSDAEILAKLEARNAEKEEAERIREIESADADQLVAQAEQFIEAREFRSAAAMLKRALILEPTNFDIAFHLATVRAEQEQLAEAIEILNSIPIDSVPTGLPAMGQAADWCVKLERFHDAEVRYEKIIHLASDSVRARRRLARILNRQGRRHQGKSVFGVGHFG